MGIKSLSSCAVSLVLCVVFGILEIVGSFKFANNPSDKPPVVLRVSAIGFLSMSALAAVSYIFFGLKESLIYQTPIQKVTFIVPAVLNVIRNFAFLMLTLPSSSLSYLNYIVTTFGAMISLEIFIVFIWAFSLIGKRLQSQLEINPDTAMKISHDSSSPPFAAAYGTQPYKMEVGSNERLNPSGYPLQPPAPTFEPQTLNQQYNPNPNSYNNHNHNHNHNHNPNPNLSPNLNSNPIPNPGPQFYSNPNPVQQSFPNYQNY
ncbi:hypothetical protein AYI68_g2573 [Smittium mucronatum]|uniref:Uncharacterized protein n=1 Tax=Smittium mucronatum TaxID=133383 RepID=A0A1R0H2B4_9FUNG|nr:hypothetical protein AYI68_g2573 [Smittium mucronatum]